MRKLLLGALCLLFVAFAVPVLASPPAVPADGLKMNLVNKDVVFNHSAHKDMKCGECHHVVDGKENYQKCATAGCHDSLDRKDKSVKGYYRVTHAKNLKFKSCVACHSDFVASHPDKKKELTGCKGSKCHP